MTKLFYIPLILLVAIFVACTRSGPEEALDRLAKAMENNNPAAFLSVIDLRAYSANYIKNMTSSAPALNSLNELGNLLGLGSIDKLIGSLVDVQAQIKNEFEKGVATGELMAQCKQALTPDCPWYPESLRDAEVIDLGPDMAVARVTTPARISSWLAMRKINNVWQITGRAEMENRAIDIARNSGQANADSGAAPSGKPEKSVPKNGKYEI